MSSATLSGTVTDGSGAPIGDARVHHTGQMVIVAATAVPPPPDEIRTDADGHFRVTTNAPAVVIRKPGYASRRVPITGDAEVQIVLRTMKEAVLCKQAPPPEVQARKANDADFAATWFYIETKDGPKGILSGSGPMYSFGAPVDSEVWRSTEYFEVMYESGMIDASGRSSDGKYWRSRSIFGATAHYSGVAREAAAQLDCVMDRVTLQNGMVQ